MADKNFDLKKEYQKPKEKYGLPDYGKMSEDFDIYKIDQKEVPYLVRTVRRSMNEKISAYLHLLELFLNPNNAPLFVLTALRNLDAKEKESIKEMYNELSKVQLEVMKLDTSYDEKKEAAFIVNTFNQWQKIKPKISKLLDKLGQGIEEEDVSQGKGYFG